MLLVTNFGFRCDPNILGTPCPVTENSSKLAVLAYYDQFSMLLVTAFGSRWDTNLLGTVGSGYVELMKTHSLGLLRPVLYAVSN